MYAPLYSVIFEMTPRANSEYIEAGTKLPQGYFYVDSYFTQV